MQLPANVQAGDTLVLFLTANSLSGTLGNPSGWTVLQSRNGSATRGRAWTKRATATDANATVTVASSATLKDTMSVSAYRSTGGNSSVTASAQTAGTATTATSHSSPTVAGRPGRFLAGQLLDREVLDWHRPGPSPPTPPPAAPRQRPAPARSAP